MRVVLPSAYSQTKLSPSKYRFTTTGPQPKTWKFSTPFSHVVPADVRGQYSLSPTVKTTRPSVSLLVNPAVALGPKSWMIPLLVTTTRSPALLYPLHVAYFAADSSPQAPDVGCIGGAEIRCIPAKWVRGSGRRRSPAYYPWGYLWPVLPNYRERVSRSNSRYCRRRPRLRGPWSEAGGWRKTPTKLWQ